MRPDAFRTCAFLMGYDWTRTPPQIAAISAQGGVCFYLYCTEIKSPGCGGDHARSAQRRRPGRRDPARALCYAGLDWRRGSERTAGAGSGVAGKIFRNTFRNTGRGSSLFIYLFEVQVLKKEKKRGRSGVTTVTIKMVFSRCARKLLGQAKFPVWVDRKLSATKFTFGRVHIRVGIFFRQHRNTVVFSSEVALVKRVPVFRTCVPFFKRSEHGWQAACIQIAERKQ